MREICVMLIYHVHFYCVPVTFLTFVIAHHPNEISLALIVGLVSDYQLSS